MILDTRLGLWLAPATGAALSLAFAPFGWWPLAVLSPACLFLLWSRSTPRQAALAGFLFTAGTYLAGTYWLYHSIHEIGRAPIALTLFVMFALVAIMAGYTAFVGYVLARWLAPPSGASAGELVQGASGSATPWRLMLVYPAAWTLLEWFRGWFLSGFPWLALGYTPIDTPLAGWGPVGGVYAISFALAVCAGAALVLVWGTLRARLYAVAAIALLWLAGWGLWQQVWTQPRGEQVSVAIVQGAVPQSMKWEPEQRQTTIELYRELTQPYLGSDLIIWPEAALPALAHELTDVLTAQWIAAHERNSALVLGQVRYDFEEQAYYNAVLALDDQPQWYAKRRLVPFAEFFPVPKTVRDWLRGMQLPYSGFKAGGSDQAALDAAGQKLAVTICYEDAYASDQLQVLREATLLVNVTNDAWFGDSTAAHQHLQISRMRALEAGRPLLRAANDGISALIGPDGRVERALPRFKPGVLTAQVQPRTGLTPYARVGNWPIVSLCVLLLAGAAWPAVRRAMLRKSPTPASAVSPRDTASGQRQTRAGTSP